MFFGPYLGVALAGAIMINDYGKSRCGALWYILFAGLLLC